MLTLKCAACKKKIWRYDKIGQGDLLRCHKARIDKVYGCAESGGKICCRCGREVGIDKGSYYKMISKAFTSSGSKRNSAEKIRGADNLPLKMLFQLYCPRHWRF